MYSSVAEFVHKLVYYSAPEHEAERSAIVRRARMLVLARHMWSHRAAALTDRVREERGRRANSANNK